MLLSFLKRLPVGQRRRTTRPERPSRRFRLERLEDRVVPTLITTNINIQAPYAGTGGVVNSSAGTGAGESYTVAEKTINGGFGPGNKVYATGAILLSSYKLVGGGVNSLTGKLVLTYAIEGQQVAPVGGATLTANFNKAVYGIYDIHGGAFSTQTTATWGPGTPGATLLYSGSLIPPDATQQGTNPPGDNTFSGQPLTGQNQANFFAASGTHAPGAFIAQTNANAANALNLLFARPNAFVGFQAEIDELNGLLTDSYTSPPFPSNTALDTNFGLVAALDPSVTFSTLTPFTTNVYAPKASGINGDALQEIGITLYPVAGAPAITTTTGGTVAVGSGTPLSDSATLSGGYNPTGSITFTLFAPGGTIVYTDVVPVSGNGTYFSNNSGSPSGGNIPTAAGTYQWVATYSGDNNNNGATSKFGDEPEIAVDAFIRITPSATNAVGVNHTFTASVFANNGDGTGFHQVTGTGTPVTETLTASNGASITQINPGSGSGLASATYNLNTDTAFSPGVTFTSPTGGKVTGHAATDVVVGGVTLHRETDGLALNSGNAVKTFVDAFIRITPSATNAVGVNHTFTASVFANNGDGTGFHQVTGTGTPVTETLTASNGASITQINPGSGSGLASATYNLNTDTAFSPGVTFTSPTGGKVTGHAATDVVVGGLTLHRETDGVGLNSGNAVKTFVDAFIQITPSATNAVNQPHTFVVKVFTNTGDGTGFHQVTDSEPVTETLTAANGASITQINPGSGSGLASATYNLTTASAFTPGVTFTSPTGGTVTGHAAADLVVGGVPIHVETNGVGANSGDAVKTFVDAFIRITPSATNAVNQPHTFVVSVFANTGDGTGFHQVTDSEPVTEKLTAANGASITQINPGSGSGLASATYNLTTASAFTPGVTFTSPTGGTVTGHAAADLVVGGVPIHVETNGVGANSGDAVKTFVDAYIRITPSATNAVNQPHTFTASVFANTGDGTGFHQVTDSEPVTEKLTAANGASITQINPGSGSGLASATYNLTTASAFTPGVTFTSPTGGTVTGHAAADLVVGGVPIHVETNGVGANSGDAVKTFVDAFIRITPSATNAVNQPHTFVVSVFANTGDGTGFHQVTDSEPVTEKLTAANGASITQINPGSGSGLASATYNLTTASAFTPGVTFTSPTGGTVTGHAAADLVVGGVPIHVETNGVGANSGDAVKTFVDAYIRITPSATNAVNQPHTFTASVFANNGDGTGFHQVTGTGTPVTETLTASNGASITQINPGSGSGLASATYNLNTDTAFSPGVTFTSPTGGKVTGHAATDVVVGGVTLHRETDGLGLNSGNAVKTFVDAYVQITPNGNNPVNAPHTFTASVFANNGDGTGFHQVTGTGTPVTETLTASDGASITQINPGSGSGLAGATYNLNTDTAFSPGVTFTSPTAGKVTGHAATDVVVGGVTLHRETDGVGLNSPDAVKTFGAPKLLLTKTADKASVVAGNQIGFTITISNTGTGPATGVKLNDPLPGAGDLNWSIESQSPANTFQITGAQGSQLLELKPNTGITLNAGVTLTVHVTSPTTAGDAGIGNGGFSFNTAGTPAAGVITLGEAGEFTVLGLNEGAGNLIINSATIVGNVGIGPKEIASALQKATVSGDVVVDPTATIQFHDKDFIVSGTFPLVKDLTQAEADALTAYNVAKGLTTDTGFAFGNVTSSLTITATAASRADGVTVVSMSSLEYKSSQLTLVGNATDVFVINITGNLLFAQSQIVLNGVTPDHVLFNLVGTNANGADVTIYKSESVWNGTLLAPYRNVLYRDPGSWTGEIIGGQTLKVYSGATFTGQLVNTATLTAANFSTQSASATITITPAHQDLAGAAVAGSAASSLTDAQLQPLLAQALARWDATGLPGKGTIDLSRVNVLVVDLPAGVLGLTYLNTIFLDRTAAGHGWFIDPTPGDSREFVRGVAVDPAAVGKVDLLTVVTHEVGHLFGFASTGSADDVMGLQLTVGARRLSMADETGWSGDAGRPTSIVSAPVAQASDAALSAPVAPAGTEAGVAAGHGLRRAESSASEEVEGLLSELSDGQESSAREAAGAFIATPGATTQVPQVNPGSAVQTAISTVPSLRWHGADLEEVLDTLPADEGDVGTWHACATAFTTREVMLATARAQEGGNNFAVVLRPDDQLFAGLPAGDAASRRDDAFFIAPAVAGDDGDEVLAVSERLDGAVYDQGWDDGVSYSALAPAVVALAFAGWSGPGRDEERGLLSRRARRPMVSA